MQIQLVPAPSWPYKTCKIDRTGAIVLLVLTLLELVRLGRKESVIPPEARENDCEEEETRVDMQDRGAGLELAVCAALLGCATELVSPLDTEVDKEGLIIPLCP